jgi:hypothetical protein
MWRKEEKKDFTESWTLGACDLIEPGWKQNGRTSDGNKSAGLGRK